MYLPYDPISSEETLDDVTFTGEGVVGVQMNPLKSVYIVRKPSQQIFVVPCFNYLPNHHISMVDLALQKRSPIDKDTSWESVCVITFFVPTIS